MIPNRCDTNNLSIAQIQYFTEKPGHPLNAIYCIGTFHPNMSLKSKIIAEFYPLRLIKPIQDPVTKSICKIYPSEYCHLST